MGGAAAHAHRRRLPERQRQDEAVQAGQEGRRRRRQRHQRPLAGGKAMKLSFSPKVFEI